MVLLLCGWATSPQATPAPQKEVGPLEIDFSPLPAKGTDDYKLHVVIETENGTRFKETYNIGAGTTATGIRDLIKASIPAGWKVQSIGDARLLIEGYKDSQVSKCDLKAEGVPATNAPVVRRPAKKEK
jgi:hypothetical protein